MVDYERLYHLMLNASEDALELLEAGDAAGAHRILTEAEEVAEELYLRTAG